MPTPNPDYREDWEEFLAYHDTELKRVEEESNRLRKTQRQLWDDGIRRGSDQYDNIEREIESLHALRDEHFHNSTECISNYQHRTIQDIARWYFEEAGTDGLSFSSSTVHDVDYEQFTTIEEVRAAHREAVAISEQLAADKYFSLPVGQPDGLNIFVQGTENEVSSSWQVFGPEEIGHHTFFLNGGYTHTLVTIDSRDGEYHICFMQDPDQARGGRDVEGEIEKLAKAIYKRALNLFMASVTTQLTKSEEVLSEKSVLSMILGESSAQNNDDDIPQPEQFNFYIHHRPRHMGREIFRKMLMRFDGDQFEKLNTIGYEVIPEIIQSAYYETAMPTVTPKDALRLGMTE